MPFTKTALNKTKKVDLIQMFLDQQAKLNDMEIGFNGWMATLEEYKMLKVENKKLKEENDEWETEYCRVESNFESLECDNKKLKEENDEWKEVAGVYWLETPSQLETWMSASIHEDDEEYSKYMEPLELRDEVEILKTQNEFSEKQINEYKDTIVSLKSSVDDLREARDKRDQQIKELKQQVDYAYKQLNELMSKVTLLKDEIESKEESESDSESEEEDECVCCGTNFDQHEARYNKGEDLRLKYQKYFGSENDDGDICPECLDKIY